MNSEDWVVLPSYSTGRLTPDVTLLTLTQLLKGEPHSIATVVAIAFRLIYHPIALGHICNVEVLSGRFTM